MNDAPLHRFSAFVDLTSGERAALRNLMGHELSFDVAKEVRVEGDDVASLYFLNEGWVFSSVGHADGSRQVLKVYRSGDMLGAPSLPFGVAVASLVALTPVKVSTIPLHKLGQLFVAHPRLAALLFLVCQEERVVLMDRLTVGGQLGAQRSLATLLLLLFDGRPPAKVFNAKLHIPLTQPQIGDVLGLSAVHVNRVMNALENEGLVKRDGPTGRIYELPDVPRLRRLVGMPERVRQRDPAWLPPPKG